MGIVQFLVLGITAGYAAHVLMVERQRIGLTMALVFGCAGSLLGAFIANSFAEQKLHSLTASGFLGSLAGALSVVVLLPMLRTGSDLRKRQ